MSQITSGSEIAIHISVRLDGVCDHVRALEVDARAVVVGVAGDEVEVGELVVGALCVADEARVLRLVGDSVGGGNSLG